MEYDSSTEFRFRGAQIGLNGWRIPDYHMPTTPFGIIPDMMINPNAIPTRMTIQRLIEIAQTPDTRPTTFGDLDYNQLISNLKQLSYEID